MIPMAKDAQQQGGALLSCQQVKRAFKEAQHKGEKLLEGQKKTYQRVFPYRRVSVNEINAYRSDAACKAIEEEKRAQ